MKAFEEWWKQVDGNCTREYGDPEVTAEMAWKAALKMALKKLNDDYERAAPGDMGWMGGFIEDELEENVELLKDD